MLCLFKILIKGILWNLSSLYRKLIIYLYFLLYLYLYFSDFIGLNLRREGELSWKQTGGNTGAELKEVGERDKDEKDEDMKRSWKKKEMENDSCVKSNLI